MNYSPLLCLATRSYSTGFPNTELALDEPNGLLALGGDLTPGRLLKAYQHAIFPWFNPQDPILWWSPNPRTVFKTDAVHVSKRMVRVLKKQDYQVTLDQDFAGVMRGCSAPRNGDPGTWITPDMYHSYCRLHKLGHAHSCEIWRDHKLIGGLYGVSLGRMFFGESMFSRETNASKIALVWLCRQLHAWGFPIMDAQVGSGHLYRMGAIDIARHELIEHVQTYSQLKAPSVPWQLEISSPF